jgi:hypothetical protein
MMGNELPYFKFVCELIDAGIWAKLSPAARTLYPVLLRFTDRNFSPVYPGSKKLMELTGFKQKSSLRKARNELVKLGLISITLGNGRTNTIYHFRFDWASPREVQNYPSEGNPKTPYRTENISPQGIKNNHTPDSPVITPYNQIHISINNVQDNPKIIQKNDEFEKLKKEFGEKNVELAISEAKLADIPVNYENILKILQGNLNQNSPNIEKFYEDLSNKISENSLKLIKNSFLREENGFFIFSQDLPLYLKNILIKLSDKILFESTNHPTNLALDLGWRKHEY